MQYFYFTAKYENSKKDPSVNEKIIWQRFFISQMKYYDGFLKSEVLTGPVKGSIIEVNFDEIESGTNVLAKIQIKLGFKYKFLLPLMKKSYKTFLMGILYKMQSIANSSVSKN